MVVFCALPVIEQILNIYSYVVFSYLWVVCLQVPVVIVIMFVEYVMDPARD